MAGSFLKGYYAQQQADNAQGANDIQRATGAMGIIKLAQDQQADEVIRNIMAQDAPPQVKLQSLLKAGPKGMAAAQSFLQMNALQAKEAEAAKKAQFFSPENQGKFMEPTYTPPATPNDDNGNINPGVEGAPRINFDRFLEAGAAQGVVDPEKYAYHLGQRELARSTAAAAQQAKKDALEWRLRDIERDERRDNATIEQRAELARMSDATRREIAALVQSNRQPQQQQIIQTDNGPMTLGPGNRAAPIIGADGKPVKGAAAGKPGKSAEAEATLRLYVAARNGLIAGLDGASTGPIAGRLPAFTTAAQTAEGGVAAMAPVLKQIFRVAGEGTFTDKDQEMLLNMVPTRNDRPEARAAKMANIDSIISAKLGIEVPAFVPPGKIEVIDPQGVKHFFDSGAQAQAFKKAAGIP